MLWGGALAVAAVGGLSFAESTRHTPPARPWLWTPCLWRRPRPPPDREYRGGASHHPDPTAHGDGGRPRLTSDLGTSCTAVRGGSDPNSGPDTHSVPAPTSPTPRPQHRPKEREVGARVAAPKEVAPVGFGTVKVIVIPYCDHLYFDGQDRGPVHTPFPVRDVPAGLHEIHATQVAGKYDTKGKVEVVADKTVTVKVDLRALTITPVLPGP